MKLLDAILHIFRPTVPQVPPELLEREAEAERKAANGFKELQQSRASYDKRADKGLTTINDDLDEQDRLMQEALGGGRS